MEYRFTVEGNPIPAARMTGSSKWTKTARRSLGWQKLVAHKWNEATRGAVLSGPIEIEMKFYRETAHRVDLDNLIKSCCDGIQYAGGFKKDDSQINRIYAEKSINRDKPRVEIHIKEIK